jgi:biopolymer transport protein ExbB
MTVNCMTTSNQRSFSREFRWLLWPLVLACCLLQPTRLVAQDEITGSDPAATTESTPGDPASSSSSAPASAVPSTPREVIQAMGPVFTGAFVIASVIALWSAIERMLMLRRRRVIPRAFVDRFLMHLRTGRMDKIEAITICQQNQSPVAEVFLHGVRKWGKPSVEIEQAVIDGGERQIGLLKKRLRLLNGVATVTPLIGLLGTVIGMIQAFNDIATADAMGQAQELAGGIAMALLTTAAGLFIAIPALVAYMYLTGRIDSLVLEMDRLGQELVHLISADALRDRAMLAEDAAGRPQAS